MRRSGRASGLPRASLNRRAIRPSDHVAHVLGVHEGHLQVNLGELRLAVGSQVLVAEALDDLEVAVEPGDHEHLLEELRALGQGVELARVDAAGHQVIARALGRALGQEGRLHLQEPVLVQVAAHDLHQPVAELQIALHERAAQVQIAVAQAHLVGERVRRLDVEGRVLAGAVELEFGGDHLHLAGGHVGVLHLRRAPGELAAHTDAIFTAQGAGGGVHPRVRLRAEDHLHDARAVPQVHEHQPAVVAPVGDPSADDDFLPDVLGPRFPASVCALEHWDSILSVSYVSCMRRSSLTSAPSPSSVIQRRARACSPDEGSRPWRRRRRRGRDSSSRRRGTQNDSRKG